jgi:uncharacterized membrane protein
MHFFGDIADNVGTIVDSVGVLVMVVGAGVAGLRVVRPRPQDVGHRYQSFRQNLGRAILIGLELMIAADIIRTVAVAPTLVSVSILGSIVLIRTFLSWSLEVEIEGRWPWQPKVKGE